MAHNFTSFSQRSADSSGFGCVVRGEYDGKEHSFGCAELLMHDRKQREGRGVGSPNLPQAHPQ